IDGGRPFPVPLTWKVALAGVKSDGAELYNWCDIDRGGCVIYDFASGPQIATCVGAFPVRLDLWDEAGRLVASPSVWVNVMPGQRARISEGLASTSEFTFLAGLINDDSELKAALTGFETRLDKADTDMTEVEQRVKQAKDDVDLIQGQIDATRTVCFIDHNDELMEEVQVRYNEGAISSTEPARSGYVFTGWELSALEGGGSVIVYKARHREENTSLLYGDPCNELLMYRDTAENPVGYAFNDASGSAYKTWIGGCTLNRSEVHSILDKGWMILSDYSDYDIGYIVNGMEIYSEKFLLERSSAVNPTAAFSGGQYARWDTASGRWISTAANRPVDGFHGYLSVSLLHTGRNRIKMVARAGGKVKVLRQYEVFVRDL
ncbi:MAG: hypothetical protein IJW09_05755, partial [Clostridia bacterium]|nr:hypothetical protein [Clostridia bacterium]